MIAGQEKIYKAIEDDDVSKLWELVRYVGYQKIKNPTDRKLAFYKAYKTFDLTRNDNFIAWYDKLLMYKEVANYRTKTGALSGNLKAKAVVRERESWPSLDDKPRNFHEDILERYIM